MVTASNGTCQPEKYRVEALDSMPGGPCRAVCLAGNRDLNL